MFNILVCDDDKEIVEAIEIYLSTEGYKVIKAYDGEEALKIINCEKIDLLIIDIMMPKLSGIQATLKLRQKKSNIPVIILSAKSEDSDKVLGLNVGADDYITKPFSYMELIARVKSQLRRYTQFNNLKKNNDKLLVNGGLLIDDDRKYVSVDGEEVKLTPIEYKILLFLIKNKRIVFSSNDLYEKIWDEYAIGAADNIVAVHVRHLREKIEINPKDPRYIKLVWGQGYKMEDLNN